MKIKHRCAGAVMTDLQSKTRTHYFSGVQCNLNGYDDDGIPNIAHYNTDGDTTVKAEQLTDRNDWKEFIAYMVNEEGIIGIFNEPLVLTEIKQPTPTEQEEK